MIKTNNLRIENYILSSYCEEESENIMKNKKRWPKLEPPFLKQ